jgi:hypothetical protein
MSRVIGYTPVFGPGCFSLPGCSGLVVPGGVDGEFVDDFSGGGVADGDVGVGYEHEDVFAGVGSADADVAELSGMAEGEFAELVDAVDALAPVISLFRSGRCRLGGCGVGGGGCSAVQGPVWAFVVVDVAELLQLGGFGGSARVAQRAFGPGFDGVDSAFCFASEPSWTQRRLTP